MLPIVDQALVLMKSLIYVSEDWRASSTARIGQVGGFKNLVKAMVTDERIITFEG